MINRQIMRITAAALVAHCATGAQAELDQQQFIEAVAMLGLNPEVAAAAGVSETELIEMYEAVSESDTSWAHVVTQREAVRAALDSIASDGEAEGMDAVESAQAALSSTLTAWRNTLLHPITTAARESTAKIIEQSGSGLPAYLLVKTWTPDELSLLSRGASDHRRQQQSGQTADSPALSFYLDAMGDSEVVWAHANWDARNTTYAQRLAEQIIELN